jgi:ABC-2 type transport system permease protein
MDFRKFLLIALKDVQLTVRDRAALLINIGAPLTLTMILGLAFGGLGSGRSPIQDIPVVIVNHDQGTAFGNFGMILAESFVNPPEGLKDLIEAEELSDENVAKMRVRQGQAAAAIIIPADFSQSLNPTNPTFGESKIKFEVYRDPGRTIQADIITGIVRQFANGFANANIAIFAAGQVNPALLLQAGAIAQEVAQRTSAETLIKIATESGEQAQQGNINLLSFFAPAMAVFFLNFATAFGAVSIIEERENGTLQRLIASPTTRLTILAGKLTGAYLFGVLQLSVLIIATSLVAPLMGITTPVWGNNIPAIVLMVLVAVAGSTGFGTLIASFVKNRQQSGIIIPTAMMLIGVAGGAFFFTAGDAPLMGPVGYLTVNHWATKGFTALAQTNVLPVTNFLALLAIFVVFFAIGVTIFSRRLDI